MPEAISTPGLTCMFCQELGCHMLLNHMCERQAMKCALDSCVRPMWDHLWSSMSSGLLCQYP